MQIIDTEVTFEKKLTSKSLWAAIKRQKFNTLLIVINVINVYNMGHLIVRDYSRYNFFADWSTGPHPQLETFQFNLEAFFIFVLAPVVGIICILSVISIIQELFKSSKFIFFAPAEMALPKKDVYKVDMDKFFKITTHTNTVESEIFHFLVSQEDVNWCIEFQPMGSVIYADDIMPEGWLPDDEGPNILSTIFKRYAMDVYYYRSSTEKKPKRNYSLTLYIEGEKNLSWLLLSNPVYS